MRHGNYVVYTILYTDQFKSDFISYYLTYFLCNNINQTQGLLYMTTATPGAHSIILQILLTGFIFYISLRCLQRFPEPFSGKFWNNCSVNRNFLELYSVTFRNSRTTSRKFPVYGKKSFRISGTFSIMEMEKIFRSFPYVNRNPEFRWKPYSIPYIFASNVADL